MGIMISEPITGSILEAWPLLIISFLTNVLIVLIIFNLSYNFLNIFTSDFMYIGLIETRPYLFWKIYYMIYFWL